MAASNRIPVVLRLVASSVCIARRAGKIIRDVMTGGSLGIVEKEKNDFQTEADRSAQRCIIGSINKQFPKVTVIGEEDLEEVEALPDDWIETGLDDEVLGHANSLPQQLSAVSDEDIVVWVDPLDGTSEFTQGLLDHVTVLIGIAVGGKAVAGVIYQPYYGSGDTKTGRVIWAVSGIGAFGFKTQSLGAEQNIVVTTRSHSTGLVTDAVDACDPTEVIRAGGAGHKVLMVLEGQASAYVFASGGCKKWDTCAPQAVLEAAGGRLTDVHGGDYKYHAAVGRANCGGVLATLVAASHQGYVDRMPAHVKDALPAAATQ